MITDLIAAAYIMATEEVTSVLHNNVNFGVLDCKCTWRERISVQVYVRSRARAGTYLFAAYATNIQYPP